MRPPAAETAPTATAETSDSRRSARWPSAKAHCRIATAAAPNARTAARVWARSCQVKDGPGTGTGHPAVQLTCESTRKNVHAIQIDTDGAHRRSTRARARTSRPAHATSAPPATMSSRNTSNASAVGIPVAPSSLTYTSRGTCARIAQSSTSAAATTVVPAAATTRSRRPSPGITRPPPAATAPADATPRPPRRPPRRSPPR